MFDVLLKDSIRYIRPMIFRSSLFTMARHVTVFTVVAVLPYWKSSKKENGKLDER